MPLSVAVFAVTGAADCVAAKGLPKANSTIEPEPLSAPLVVKPRARTLAPAGTLTPVNCQPPEMRVPDPRLVQFTPPLAEDSNVVHQHSGPPPARSQVKVLPLSERFCVPGTVFKSRPIEFRVTPPNETKRAAKKNGAIGLRRQRVNHGGDARIEAVVQAAVRVQPADTVARLTTQGREDSPHQHLAVGLDQDGVYRSAGIGNKA